MCWKRCLPLIKRKLKCFHSNTRSSSCIGTGIGAYLFVRGLWLDHLKQKHRASPPQFLKEILQITRELGRKALHGVDTCLGFSVRALSCQTSKLASPATAVPNICNQH